MAYESRLPEIVDEIADRMDTVTGQAARLMEAHAKAGVAVETGRLQRAIHVERYGPSRYAVIAGNYEVFYGHIVEHGGHRQPAQPFMTPASEMTSHEIKTLGDVAFRNL